MAEAGGVVSWTTTMSNYMIDYLVEIVSSGGRTSSGFKSVHYNACARALNDHFKLQLTRDQISNHFRTIRKRFAKIEHIKNVVSGANWDEDTCMIRMEHDMAVDYIKKHKNEAEYINRPTENYKEMQILYGNRLATGRFAKGSGESLGTETNIADEHEAGDEGEEEEVDGPSALNANIVAPSSAKKPTKKAKTTGGDDDGLVATLGRVGSMLAGAITTAGEKCAPKEKQDEEVSDDLHPLLMSFSGFNESHVARHYAYLVEHPSIAKAFMKMSSISQRTWIVRYINMQQSRGGKE